MFVKLKLYEQERGLEVLRVLTQRDFPKVYEIMEQSFPRSEYRPYEAQLALMERSNYRIYGEAEMTGELQGFMAVWELPGYCFLEHFAVSPMERNGGIGSAMLKELQELYHAPLCLEVEPPENELTRRRVAFYERNGFYLNAYPYEQPSLGEGREPVPLQVMTTGSRITRETFERLKETLYTEVYDVAL